MNIKNLIVSSLVVAAAIAAPFAAYGADLAPVPYPTIDRGAIVEVVNFDGPYVGISGTTLLDSNVYTPQLSVGLDKRYGAFIVGGEAFATVNLNDEDNAQTIPTIGFDAKAGFAVTDNVAVYALAGVEVNTDTEIARNSIGIGADIAITPDVYVTGSYKQVTDLGTFDNADNRVTVGLKFPL